MAEAHRYWTYLIRFWPVGRDSNDSTQDNGGLAWHASALDVYSGEQIMFAEPSMLIDFLADVGRRLPQGDEQAQAEAKRQHDPAELCE
jgi:hypothetical protein